MMSHPRTFSSLFKRKLSHNDKFHYSIWCIGWATLPGSAHNTGVNICRDCVTYFGQDSLQPITRDDSVVCETQYSKVVPLEGGEVCVDKGTKIFNDI